MGLSGLKNSDIVLSEGMRRRIVITVKKPIFFAKKGMWGEKGMVRVSFWKYLWLQSHHVTKVRWILCTLFKK